MEARSENEEKLTFTKHIVRIKNRGENRLLLMLRKLNHEKFIIFQAHFHQMESGREVSATH